MIRTNHLSGRCAFLCAAYVAVWAALTLAPASFAQDSALQVEPAQTKIQFSLDSSLHTVHGTFALKSSSLRFDPASGKISGSVVVDATSGESGNSGRDSRMHREILESAKFPEIVFTPAQVMGTVAASGPSKVDVSGTFRLHGKDHDVTLPVEITADGQSLQIAIHYVIPYVQWGLKNPSNFFLKASDKVEIEIHATGRIESASAAVPR
jgi:polyisoprenoid-binding protein YceI